MNCLNLEISHLKTNIISHYKSSGCSKASGILQDENGDFIYLISLGGGLVSGDEYIQKIRINKGVKIALKSQSNQKVYKSIDDKFAINSTEIIVENNACLYYENDALVAYSGAKLRQKTDIFLSENSRLFYFDGICNGYSNDGAGFGFDEILSISNFYINDKIALSDRNFFDKNTKNFGLFRDFKFNFFILLYDKEFFINDDLFDILNFNDDMLVSASSPQNGFLCVRILANYESEAKKVFKNLKEIMDTK